MVPLNCCVVFILIFCLHCYLCHLPTQFKHGLKAEDRSVMGCDSLLSGGGQIHQKCIHFWLSSFAVAIFTIDLFGPDLCLKSFDVTSKPSNWTNKCSCFSERNCLRSELMKLWLVLIRAPLRSSCTSEDGIHHRLRN